MRGLVAVALLALLVGCQAPPAEMTPEEIAQIEAEIDQLTESLMSTWNAMDTDAYMEFYSPTKISHAWGGRVHRDIPSLRERQQEWFDLRESWEGAWTEKTIEVLSEDAVIFQGMYECTIGFPDGRVLHWPGNASWTAVFQKEADEWKLTFAGGSAGGGTRIDAEG